MTRKSLAFAVYAGLLVAHLYVCKHATASAPNLAPDPSFDAPVGSWFIENGAPEYSAQKHKLETKENHGTVLRVTGWRAEGARIASHPLSIRTGYVSATIAVRTDSPSIVDFQLSFEDQSKSKLLNFASVRLSRADGWRVLHGTSKLQVPAYGRIVLRVRGGSYGASSIDVDDIGVFEAQHAEAVVDTSFFESVEAELLAGQSAGWQRAEHFSSWYPDRPLNGAMLSGSAGVARRDNLPARHHFLVNHGGHYVLWTRTLRTDERNSGSFVMEIRQQGRRVGVVELNDTRLAELGAKSHEWFFVPLPATLVEGDVEVVMQRPTTETSWVARKIDMFLLTNLPHFVPKAQDFRTQGYVRFHNESDQDFCLFAEIRRHEGPPWFVHHMYTQAGAWDAYQCPAEARVKQGGTSPWIKLSDDLSPEPLHNNLSLIATRDSHTTDLLAGLLRGRLDFAQGLEKLIVKSIPFEQRAPRILLTIGSHFDAQSIRTSFDYLAQAETNATRAQPVPLPTARFLELSVILSGLRVGLDPEQLVERELAVIRRLGFNASNTPLTLPPDMVNFYKRHDLLHAGTWPPPLDMGNVNSAAEQQRSLVDAWRGFAQAHGPSLAIIEHVKLLDEPHGDSAEALLANATTAQRFREWLIAQHLTASSLGAKRWSEVLPRSARERTDHAREFYYTELFRLWSYAQRIRKANAAKADANIPSQIQSYVNYSPTWSGGSFTSSGVDPFYLQRDGGLEMSWSEDWLGWGISTEHVSDHLGVLRSASHPHNQPIGMYIVAVDGPANLQRLKFYESLSAGVTHFCSYNYGPSYASTDSWGTRYEVYPPISKALHEFAVIDKILERSHRRPTQAAVLYNRTAAIWSLPNTAQEQDARYAFWAFSHAGYQPNFLPEEDIESGELARYKSLYISGTHIRRRTAVAIAHWVSSGGVVVASAGAATRDEFDQPLHVLDAAMGLQSSSSEILDDAGRPRFELRSLKPLGIVTATSGSNALEFPALAVRETLLPSSRATVTMQFADGRPAGLRTRFGRGETVRIAALPGLAYVHETVARPDYDPESYKPRGYRQALRDVITQGARASGAEYTATNETAVEVTRFDAEDATLLVLVNHGPPTGDLRVTVHGAFASGRSASGAVCETAHASGGSTEIQLALDTADALVLEPVRQ